MSQRATAATALIPGVLIEITQAASGRYTAWYQEWQGSWRGCCRHAHLTRQDALACAEERLRYRA